MAELVGEKKLLESKTVKGAILGILSSIGTLLVIVKGGVPPEILYPALATTATSVWGNIVSIFGRKQATVKIS